MKGSVAFLRDFNRGAAHNELGIQATEITGENVDGDSDGVMNELSVGDITALTTYLAARPRPTTLLELNSLGLIDPLSQSQIDSINRGYTKFIQIGCNTCHVPAFELNNPTFTEPSQDPNYRDPDSAQPIQANALRDPLTPPAVLSPSAKMSAAMPVMFDLTKDQPDNQIKDQNGNLIFHLGALRTDSRVLLPWNCLEI